jgi:hypothetical protein
MTENNPKLALELEALQRAMDAMSEAWDKHVGFGRARLKVDRP